LSVGFQLGVAAGNLFFLLLAIGTLGWFSYHFFWRGILKRYYRLWRRERSRMGRLMKERMEDATLRK
jgi:hypothetical protein